MSDTYSSDDSSDDDVVTGALGDDGTEDNSGGDDETSQNENMQDEEDNGSVHFGTEDRSGIPNPPGNSEEADVAEGENQLPDNSTKEADVPENEGGTPKSSDVPGVGMVNWSWGQLGKFLHESWDNLMDTGFHDIATAHANDRTADQPDAGQALRQAESRALNPFGKAVGSPPWFGKQDSQPTDNTNVAGSDDSASDGPLAGAPGSARPPLQGAVPDSMAPTVDQGLQNDPNYPPANVNANGSRNKNTDTTNPNTWGNSAPFMVRQALNNGTIDKLPPSVLKAAGVTRDPQTGQYHIPSGPGYLNPDPSQQYNPKNLNDPLNPANPTSRVPGQLAPQPAQGSQAPIDITNAKYGDHPGYSYMSPEARVRAQHDQLQQAHDQQQDNSRIPVQVPTRYGKIVRMMTPDEVQQQTGMSPDQARQMNYAPRGKNGQVAPGAYKTIMSPKNQGGPGMQSQDFSNMKLDPDLQRYLDSAPKDKNGRPPNSIAQQVMREQLNRHNPNKLTPNEQIVQKQLQQPGAKISDIDPDLLKGTRWDPNRTKTAPSGPADRAGGNQPGSQPPGPPPRPDARWDPATQRWWTRNGPL